MPIRNPFGRRPGASVVYDENARAGEGTPTVENHPKFEREDTTGSKSSALSVRTSQSTDTGEYKLSVVNDSGIYLPPSPTEETPERSPWSPRRYLPSRRSCDTPTSTGEIEHFSISRESFDSYRRSFDICAKSPVTTYDIPARQSLDSTRLPRHPRSSIGHRFARREPATEEEEAFEDVGLDDPPSSQQAPAGRRRGLFSMFGETQNTGAGAGASMPAVSRLIAGRRRNHSGQGSELGRIERPGTATASESEDEEVARA